jgi:hypothetical protein
LVGAGSPITPMFSFVKFYLSCLQQANDETINEGHHRRPCGGLFSSIGGGKYISDTLYIGEKYEEKT